MKIRIFKVILILFVFSLVSVLFIGQNTEKTGEIVVKASQNEQPFDLSIVNEERVIEMLKASGKIAENASPEEVEEGLNIYIQSKKSNAPKESGILERQRNNVKKNLTENMSSSPVTKGKGNKLGHTKEYIPTVESDGWDGTVKTGNILVILVDFADYSHNSMTPDETDMYYEDYTIEHYEDMIFGDDGYIGPNGEHFMSMKQYYEEQSGGSYTLNGTVVGWYTSSKTVIEADMDVRSFVKEAVDMVAYRGDVDLSQFDNEDLYDLDGDGNYSEPDGIIDHVMIIHAGAGEEAGGGVHGENAIWSHSWSVGYPPHPVPNYQSDIPYWGGALTAYNYTIQPEDGAIGVVSHEYGHDLGLPDEYDTDYTGRGEPVSYWSIMASGSWTGLIGGTEPTGFSPLGKLYFQSKYGGNWLSGTAISVEDLDEPLEVYLDQASTKGTNNDVVMVDLPDKEKTLNVPTSGEYEYFSGKGNNMYTYMFTPLDLRNTSNVTLKFNAWYKIENDWDYASVFVFDGAQFYTVEGNITTTSNPHGQNPGHGITGDSNGWVEAEFDLSAFSGSVIYLGIDYWTDLYTEDLGLYVDDISVFADGQILLLDNVEGEPAFNLQGFTIDRGKIYFDHYYLLEWRNHQGSDVGLSHIPVLNSVMEYDPGLVIWYVDESYEDNWVGLHPGDGYIGVVDADQHLNMWSDNTIASTRYQIHDAAFSIQKTEKMFLDLSVYGFTLKDNHTKRNPLFDDSYDYSNTLMPDAGRNIPSYGLKIRVIGESNDRSVGKIIIFK